MRLGAWGIGFACLGLVATQAEAAISLAVALRNHYAEYEIVRECALRAQLTPGDLEAAQTAMVAIEKYYLNRDDSLDKARLAKQATVDSNDSFKILARSGDGSIRPYCQMSLNELLRKARDVGAE